MKSIVFRVGPSQGVHRAVRVFAGEVAGQRALLGTLTVDEQDLDALRAIAAAAQSAYEFDRDIPFGEEKSPAVEWEEAS